MLQYIIRFSFGHIQILPPLLTQNWIFVLVHNYATYKHYSFPTLTTQLTYTVHIQPSLK
jgi:hypothetical protein